MIDTKQGKGATYSSLVNVYLMMSDTAGGMDVLKKGRLAYPNDINLVISETNYFLKTNQLDFLDEHEASANIEALLSDATERSRHELYLESNQQISEEIVGRFKRMVLKRKQRVPLAYVTGKAYFWDEVLDVRPGCLIPRPETELIIEKFFEKNISYLDSNWGVKKGGLSTYLKHRYIFEKGRVKGIKKLKKSFRQIKTKYGKVNIKEGRIGKKIDHLFYEPILRLPVIHFGSSIMGLQTPQQKCLTQIKEKEQPLLDYCVYYIITKGNIS